MAYTAPEFWLFLASVLGAFAIVALRFRPWLLLGASLLFYGQPDPLRLLWVAGVIGVVLATQTGGRQLCIGGALLLVFTLVLTKFAGSAGVPIPMAPPGFSFLTFTAVAHLMDVSRNPARVVPGLALALHLAWFPKILAGPIERSWQFVSQIPMLCLRPGLAGIGFTLILSGLLKKLVIADNLAPVVDAAYGIPQYAAPLDLLIASYFFAFQIYCDFSGYSDLALGFSALVGLRLSQNFNRPYMSQTVTAFWSERWHITLGKWFRDYVYIPLGGSRVSHARRVFNVMSVFMLSGLWHAGLGYGVGWGFLVWGALNGAFVVLESALPMARPGVLRPLGVLVTFHLILVTWVFFRAASLDDAWVILSRIATGLTDFPNIIPSYPFTGAQRMGAALIGTLLVVELAARGRDWPTVLAKLPTGLRWGLWYGALATLLVLGRWQGAGFIYAGF